MSSPEKVLGLTRRWADKELECLDQLLLALHHSAKWCGRPNNAGGLSQLVHSATYLDPPVEHFTRGLLNTDGFPNFDDSAANFPWQSHALCFYAQMVRWGHSRCQMRQVPVRRPPIDRMFIAEP
jgi:NitT/TauT family transport system ATP-binding protein